MSLSKNVAPAFVAPASKKNRLFGLSRDALKFVSGAGGVIISNPLELPVTTIDGDPVVVPVLPATIPGVDPIAP